MNDSETKKNHEKKLREEGRKKESPLFDFKSIWKPMRLILVLLAIIALLLLLMWFFGLGSGGGKPLPGSSATPNMSLQKQTKETGIQDKSTVRRELHLSFVPSASDEEIAKELICNVSWTDAKTGSRETRVVSENNMDDFEFKLEQKIRDWFVIVPQDVPVVVVHMMPFPGEGTLQKITKIVHEIDSRISIMRLEK